MPTVSAKRRFCENCGERKPARWPKTDPHFCSMRCAANVAHMETSQRWCETHGEWFHEDDGCYECQQEGGAE